MRDELAALWQLKYRLHHTPERRAAPQDRPEPQAAVMAWLRDLGVRAAPPFGFGLCDVDCLVWVFAEGRRVPVFIAEIVPGGGGEEARKARLQRRYKQLDALLGLKLPLFIVEFGGPEDVCVLRYRAPANYEEVFFGSLEGLDAFLVDKLERAYKFHERRLRQRP
jgi:hypothetical protein